LPALLNTDPGDRFLLYSCFSQGTIGVHGIDDDGYPGATCRGADDGHPRTLDSGRSQQPLCEAGNGADLTGDQHERVSAPPA